MGFAHQNSAEHQPTGTQAACHTGVGWCAAKTISEHSDLNSILFWTGSQ